MSKLQVLLLEAECTIGATLAEALRTNYDCDVEWAIRIRSLKPLTIVTHAGEKTLPNRLDAAFIDGGTEGDVDCCDLVAELSSQGVTCVGISFAEPSNKKMIEDGAVAACNKPFAVAAVVLSELPALKDLANARSSLQEQLKRAESIYRSDPAKHERVHDEIERHRKK
jgi:hypothetical protein